MLSMHRVRAVVFDCDGTPVDSGVPGSAHDTRAVGAWRVATARPPTAMARARSIRIAATANVSRKPVATTSGRACVMVIVPEASANTAPITDAPVIRPRLRDRLSRPEMTPRCCAWMSAMTAVLLAVWNSAYPTVVTTIGAM